MPATRSQADAEARAGTRRSRSCWRTLRRNSLRNLTPTNALRSGLVQGVSMSVEAHRVEARSLRLYSWSFNTFGVGHVGDQAQAG